MRSDNDIVDETNTGVSSSIRSDNITVNETDAGRDSSLEYHRLPITSENHPWLIRRVVFRPLTTSSLSPPGRPPRLIVSPTPSAAVMTSWFSLSGYLRVEVNKL
ncbi:hypothetical protein J6590_079226 [Homalodisca vitripennis]|nr:hypothetical protein J6590_079226 [Homalodisca vitripennis]